MTMMNNSDNEKSNKNRRKKTKKKTGIKVEEITMISNFEKE